MIKRFYILGFYFLFSALVASAQWTALNGPPGGNMNDLELDVPNGKIYTVVNNSLYISSNDGTAWTRVVPTTPANLYISDLLIDGSTLFALYYSQLFSSTDGGANWTKISVNGAFDGAYKMIKVATGVYAVYGYNGVYVSKDAGVNWVKISSVRSNSAIANAAGDLYFADMDGIKRHVNPGVNPWASGNVATVYVRANDYNTRLAVLGTAFFAVISNDVLKSTDGTTWTTSKTGIADTYFQGTWANSPAGLYLVNYTSKIYFTTTASSGGSWSTLAAFPTSSYGGSSVNDLRFASASKAFAGTSGDGVFKTLDTGATWTLATGGIYLADARDVVVGTGTPPRVFVRTGYQSKGSWMSDDKGLTWFYSGTNGTSTPPNDIARLVKMPDNTLLGIGGGPAQYSTNNGVGWSAAGTGTDFISYATYNTTFSTSPTYVYGMGSNRLASSTTGSIWNTITVTGLPTSYYPYGIAQDNGGTLYVLLYNYNNSKYEFYKIPLSSAAAISATATLLTLPLVLNDQSYFSTTGMFVNNNKLYIGSYNAIYITADQGTTWTPTVFSNNAIFGLPNGIGICASTYGALYVSSDDGLSWSNNGLPGSDGFIRSIAYDAANTTYYGGGYNTPALKDVATTLVPALPPPYINFNWTAINGPWGGNVRKVLTDNANNSFALASEYVYKTTSFSSWTNVSPGIYLYDVAIDKVNSILYGLSYNQLLKSIDGGTNWTLLNNENFGDGTYLRRSSNGDIVFSDRYKVYVSTNGGTTFGAAKYTTPNSSYIYNVEVNSTGIFLYYYDSTVPGYQIARSIDRGSTWSIIASPITYISSLSTNAGDVYLVGANSNTYNVYKSTDNGANWTSIKGDLTGSFYFNVFVSPTNDLYLTGRFNGSPGLFKSINGGINWTFLNTGFWTYGMNWVGTRVVVGSDRGIFTSDDGGATFTNRSIGIPVTSLQHLELSSPNRIVASDGSQSFYSTDFQNWNTLSNYTFRGFLRKPDGTLLAFDNTKLYTTTDGGNTWNVISSTLPNLNTLATADGTTYYGVSYNKIYFSNNLTTWTQLNPTGLPNNMSFTDIAVDLNGLIYVTLYNYTSGAEAYEILFGAGIKINQPKNPYNVEFSQNQIFLYDGSGAVFLTSDGSTWTKKSTPGGNKLIIASQNYYFIPAYGGSLWLSRDQAQTWQNVGGTSGSNYNFNDVVVNEYNGYAYGAITNSPVRKSGNIVIPADAVPPAVVTLSPINNSTGISVKPALSITFDQAAVPVTGKKVRILDLANPVTPVEIIDAAAGIQNGKTFTFTPVNLLSFGKTYFIIVDNGAFTDIFANAWAGITSNATWRITTKATPTVVSTTPATNSTSIALNSNLVLTFSEPMTGVSGKKINVYKSSAPSTPAMQIDASAGLVSGNAITYTLASPLSFLTQYFVTSDLNAFSTVEGATVSLIQNNTDWVFTSRALPTVTTLVPAKNATNVALNTSLAVTFSELLTPVNGKNLYIYSNAQPSTLVATLAATAGAASGNTRTYTLTSPLLYLTQYYVTFDPNSFTSVEGAPASLITSNTDWVFTSRALPTVTTLVPAKNATNVALNTSLAVTFSELLTPATGKKLYIYNNALPSTPVATLAATSGVVSGNTRTYTLTSPLLYLTQYYVTFDPNSFTSVEGAPTSLITSNTDWVFTSRALPTITTLAPAKNATNISLNTSLAVTFSELLTPVNGKNLYIYSNAQPSTLVATLAATSGVVSGNTRTYTLPSPLSYLKQYYVTFDPNSFTSVEGAPTSLITSNTDWTFTTQNYPDKKPPVITHTADNINKGAVNKTISVGITDSVSVASAKIFFRAITTNNPTDSAVLTLNNANGKYEVSIPEASFGKIGLEYRFRAMDPANNIAISPTANTKYYSYITYPNAANPTLPSLPSGGQPADWKVIAIPYLLSDSKVSTIFNELGTSDKTLWRLLTYQSQTAWAEYPADFSTIQLGKGYFINIKSTTSILIEGASTPNNNKEAPFKMNINSGWNQIGNPYPFPVTWSEVLTANGNPAGITTLKTFNGTYQNVTTLQAFEGGFVFNSGAGTVNLTFPVVGSGSGGRIGESIHTALDGKDWVAPISLTMENLTYSLGGVGMNPMASLSVDDFDDVTPPRFIKYMEVNFAHPEHFAKNLTRDVVPTQEEYTWEFTVNTNLKGLAELTWDNRGFGNGSKELLLYDEYRQLRIDMRALDHYQFDPTQSNQFRISYGENLKDKIKPERVTLGEAYPNPAGGMAIIPFTLPDYPGQQGPYQVRLEVYDMMGQRVNTLVDGELPAGFYQSQWSNTEGNLTNGLYTYRLSVSAGQKQEVHSGKVILKR